MRSVNMNKKVQLCTAYGELTFMLKKYNENVAHYEVDFYQKIISQDLLAGPPCFNARETV